MNEVTLSFQIDLRLFLMLASKQEPIVSVYPNPFNKHFNVDLEGFITDAEITLFDSKGCVVAKKNAIKGTSQVAFQHYERGLYFVQIRSNEFSKVIKVISE